MRQYIIKRWDHLVIQWFHLGAWSDVTLELPVSDITLEVQVISHLNEVSTGETSTTLTPYNFFEGNNTNVLYSIW